MGCGSPTPATTATSKTTIKTSAITTFSTFTPPANPQLLLSSTTSVRDSGLMDVLLPLFQQKTGYQVKPIYNGSGAAIALGAQGEADVMLVHSPVDEIPFMQAGNGTERIFFMHNDFVIVGPPSDPAKVKGSATAADALKKISDAKAAFYSRGDKSGTDTLEKGLWKAIGITVADGAAINPSWYIEGGAGTGMGALLNVASEKNGYTITDRATYLANKSILKLDVLTEGDPKLLNYYHVITVNAQKFPKVNAAGAKAFADFVISPEAQTAIAKYGVDKYGGQLFFPDAGKPDPTVQ